MADALKNAIAQSLECPVCLNTFTDPKILSCSHTYCKTCLDNLLDCHGNDQMLRCPVCRAETQVPNQDVSKLPANLALKSLIEDVKNQYQFCTNCKSKEAQAVVYCQDCGKYFCSTCHNKHSQWPDFISHDVLAMSEIVSGKVSVRRYRKCRKHPKDDEEWFCSDCRRFACFKCVVMEHTNEGHRVIEAAVYESNHVKSIEDLKSKADKKRSCFQKYIDFIDEQKEHVSNVQKQCTDDINKAYEESVRQLTKKKEVLIGEVKGRTEGVEKELDEIKKSAQEHITHFTTIADVVTNRTKIPLDTDALAAHDTLCQDLQEALKQEDPDYKQSIQLSRKGKSVSFKRNVGMDELALGKIANAFAFKNIALPTKNSMNIMVGTPDGRMAVGCDTGGVEIFSADGQLQQTVLKGVKIRGVGFLSDDRYVILDCSNNISLYRLQYTKLNVVFETLYNDEGEWAILNVGGDDQIYVSYWKAQKIQVFSPAGGKAIREIPCDGYEPQQITSYNDYLVTRSWDAIRLIDKEGVVKYELRELGYFPYATVSQGNTILIAKVNHDVGLVSIDEYTNELKHVQKLVIDYKIEKPERNWYFMQQYQSGEIAFCTPDRLYIFHWK
ncbi:tripartite motif-containing protein 2-like [Strongylocentrotus purpuratus]|uniref:Uncharacterized protein n=1 Tax=Strongylocentrotus purpuratus TaxID=7668 RepID=A0A7M7P9N4_STRPU|nr:tripartite motif-containing protein 2-like [Strongylocentrotus purpuratus]